MIIIYKCTIITLLSQHQMLIYITGLTVQITQWHYCYFSLDGSKVSMKFGGNVVYGIS